MTEEVETELGHRLDDQADVLRVTRLHVMIWERVSESWMFPRMDIDQILSRVGSGAPGGGIDGLLVAATDELGSRR